MNWVSQTVLTGGRWAVVLAGTVTETHKERDPFYGGDVVSGTLKINKVLLQRGTRDKIFKSASFMTSRGFDGLEVGDKILVFVVEYDGGYGIPNYHGSGSKLGIKVRDFDEPILSAVEAMIQHPERNMLKNKRHLAAWQRCDPEGVHHYRAVLKTLGVLPSLVYSHR